MFKELKMQEQKVIDVINEMISLCEPIKYKDFNLEVAAMDKEGLRMIEKKNPEVGLANYDHENEGISTLSIIATITDVLVQKRLAFIVDNKGFIIGIKWFEKE